MTTEKTYKLSTWGYGSETVIGTVSKETYEYFEENEIDIDDYANDWDDVIVVPEELKPFSSGEWYNCDDIFHGNGVEMSAYSSITISDEDDNEIWTHNLDTYDLNEHGIVTTELSETYIKDLEKDKVVFFGAVIDKGEFNTGEFTITEEFDPTKLALFFDDVEGSCLLSSFSYDGVDIDTDYGSTSGKSSDFRFEVVNG